MGLFGKKDDEKILMEMENDIHFGEVITYEFTSNSKYLVTLDDKFLTIELQGMLNMVNKGKVGKKTIKISSITSLQLAKPGATTGYLQVGYSGGTDKKGGVFDAVEDENTITFTKKEYDKALELRRKIMERM